MKLKSFPGLIPYDEASEIQKKMVEDRIADRIDDTVLFLEHPPVVTRGRGLQRTDTQRRRQMPDPELPGEISFFETERGGDLTYHGPGQLVIYPIFKIKDVNAFIRKLEVVVVSTLAEWGVRGEVRKNSTGVWVGEKKIASIGIAVRKWVSYHGIAINVVNDLKPFHYFSPCGFSSEVMTRLSDHVQGWSDEHLRSWRGTLTESLFRNFSPPHLKIREGLLAQAQSAEKV